jgi:FMN phosphatase YigB (HAD superfamily)
MQLAKRQAEPVLKDLEISSYLDPILLSEDVKIEKPDARIFRLVFSAQPVSVEPQESVHVGDELDKYDLTFRQ